MDLNRTILSDIIMHTKYARWVQEQLRRETFQEGVARNEEMHIQRFPQLETEIRTAYKQVYAKRVLPSMRSMQFAGKPIELAPNRIFNCCFLHIDDYRAFSEVMFLLLGGSGVGYSVQKQHVEKLPPIRKPIRNRRYLVGDSIEGWADAIKMLMKAYFRGASLPIYDFSDVRPKGARLITSGGKAPGPEPLKRCLFLIQELLDRKNDGDQLTPLEAHDVLCYIADAVLAGGIRRSAMISLFSLHDEEMLTCKAGTWYELNPQRGRANNSAVAVRSKLKEADFRKFFAFVRANNTGEPGIFLTNNPNWGLNPCGEASLRDKQGCNLTEINASAIFTQEDLLAAAKAAAFIGTLQASYTDFHYLRSAWQRTFERDALLGVGITGLANKTFLALDLETAAKTVTEENERVASLIGIKKAARTTLVKPSGTTSLLLGTSSGIHDWHAKFFLRRIKLLKNEAIYKYLINIIPELIEDDWEKPHLQAVLTVPLKAPEGAIVRADTEPTDLLERVADVYARWVRPGHRSGDNTHAISCTVNVRTDEWDGVEDWMWEHRESYNCISVFPYWGGTHKQMPYEECDEAKYLELTQLLKEIDLTQVTEIADETDLTGEAACAGGACEIVFD